MSTETTFVSNNWRYTVRAIAIFYGFWGILNFLTVLLFLVYGTSLVKFSSADIPNYIFVFGFPLICGIIGMLVMYSLFTFKSWGRYLAIWFNTLWAATWILGITITAVTEHRSPELTLP